MNCCDRILILFLAFAFAQFSFRWHLDKEISQAPWQTYVLCTSNLTKVKTSSSLMFYKQAIAYGTPTSKVEKSSIVSHDRQEIFVILYINITAPPMSFHRIQLTMNDKPVREVSLFTSPIGKAHGTLYTSFIHLPSLPIKLKYVFDDIWSAEGLGKADVHMVLRSGYTSLWDVKWADVYI